ncbi:MAG: hypothetical protein WD885_03275 [Candidatus Saccharimonadales bacterium]
MGRSNSLEVPAFEYVEKRLCKPIDLERRSIGLTAVVGTHGMDTDSMIRLVRDGEFSRAEAVGLGNNFYLTFNPSYKYWKKSDFAEEAARAVGQAGIYNPVKTSIGYASSRLASSEPSPTPVRYERGRVIVDELTDSQEEGFVLSFNNSVLPLINEIRLDENLEGIEAEIELRNAPSLPSVSRIYPISEVALDSIRETIQDLR